MEAYEAPGIDLNDDMLSLLLYTVASPQKNVL